MGAGVTDGPPEDPPGTRDDGHAPSDREVTRWIRIQVALALLIGLVWLPLLSPLRDHDVVHGSLPLFTAVVLPWGFLVTYAVVCLVDNPQGRALVRDPRFWRTSLLFVGVVLSAFIVVVVAAGDTPWWQDLTVVSTDDPGEGVLPPGMYEDVELNVTGWVAVHRGEVLRLSNVTLRVSTTNGRDGGIWVGSGGRLEVLGSRLEAATAHGEFSFEVHGSAIIEGSRITGTLRKRGGDRVDGGLEVYSDDVVISNTTFHGEEGRGVSVSSAAPRILDCSFEGLYVGIYAGMSDVTVEGCYFEGCDNSVWVSQDGSTVRNCTFINCSWGVETSWVSATTIEGCTFEDSEWAAIQHTDYTDTVMRDNTFLNNTEDVRYITHSTILWLTGPYFVRNVCVGTAVISSVVTMTYILFGMRTARRRGD